MTDIEKAIAELEKYAPDPAAGLPDELFRFVCRLTPQVNVDLLIRDNTGRVLMTWRNDVRDDCVGWHLPGGMIRLKENAAERVAKVAELELGTQVEFDSEPKAFFEMLFPEKRERSHGYSLLYECRLRKNPPEELKYVGGDPMPGVYAWFEKPPEKMVKVHEIYKKYFNMEK